MKFLADAHISREMIAMLRRLGHAVRGPETIPPRLPDLDVLRGAAAEGRVVLTADTDFGELVFLHAIPAPGVVLLRLPQADEADRVAWVERLWPEVMAHLPGRFVTVSHAGVRQRAIPIP